MIQEHVQLGALLLAVLNPFMLSIYLLDLIKTLGAATFAGVLLRAAAISVGVFLIFAAGGESIFSRFLHVHFGSFQIFGGLIFIFIGAKFVFSGVQSLQTLRGSAKHVVGSIAMPFMIGPGTVSASVVIGSRAGGFGTAAAIIASTVMVSILIVIALKLLHDRVRKQNAELVERYVEVVGRISGLVIGTIAVEMMYLGVLALIEDGM